MRKLTAVTHVTLDGVMQSPGGSEEDPRHGFVHGGWIAPFADDALNEAIGEILSSLKLGDLINSGCHSRRAC
jgi:hypothetical protein